MSMTITTYTSPQDVCPLGSYVFSNPLPTHDGGMPNLASIDAGSVPTNSLCANPADTQGWGSCDDSCYDSITGWVKVDNIADLGQDLYAAVWQGKIYLRASADELATAAPDNFATCPTGDEGSGITCARIDSGSCPTTQSQGFSDLGLMPCPMTARETYLKTTDGRWRADVDWSVLAAFKYYPDYYYGEYLYDGYLYHYYDYRTVVIYCISIDELLCFYSAMETARVVDGTITNTYSDYLESNYATTRCRYDGNYGYAAVLDNLLPYNQDGSTPYTGTTTNFELAPIAPTARGRIARIDSGGCPDSTTPQLATDTHICYRACASWSSSDLVESLNYAYAYDPTIWEGRGLGTAGGVDYGGHIGDSAFTWHRICTFDLAATHATHTITIAGGYVNHIMMTSAARTLTPDDDFYRWRTTTDDDYEELDPDDPESPDTGGFGNGGSDDDGDDVPSGGISGGEMPTAAAAYVGSDGITVTLKTRGDGDYYWLISIAADTLSTLCANLTTEGELTFNADHTFSGANAPIYMGIGEGTATNLVLVFNGTNDVDASLKSKTYALTHKVTPTWSQPLKATLPIDETLTCLNGIAMTPCAEGSAWINATRWYQLTIDSAYLRAQLTATLRQQLAKKPCSDSQTSTSNGETLSGSLTGTALNPTITIT